MQPSVFGRIAAAAGIAALAICAGPAAAQIGVEVNGQTVRFESVAPQRIGGRVFIPLRAVSEALGAEVQWDASSRTVRGRKGEREFSLPIGSSSALVNGAQVRLDQPAQIAFGTTMVPLRFVAEALGAEVEWNAPAQRVVINSPQDGGTRTASTRISGEVVAVRPGDSTLTVLVGGVRQTYRVDRDTIILRGAEGQRGLPVELGQIQPGDDARLRVHPENGSVEVVEAFTNRPVVRDPVRPPDDELIAGEIISIRRTGTRQTIALRTETGRVSYDVDPTTRFIGPGGTRLRLDELAPGDQVRIRTDVRSGLAQSVEITGSRVPDREPLPPVAAPDLRVTSFGHNAPGVLRSGSEVRFSMIGTPGGTATADIGGLRRGIPLREDPLRPGRYEGVFTVPAGVTAKELPILGQLTVAGKSAPLIQAGTPLNIDSEPPVVSETAPMNRAQAANAQPDIYAEISDGGGAGIDRASLRMVVAGRDVTDRVRVTPRFVIYSPDRPLPPGEVPVSLRVKDLAGNETLANWSFMVRSTVAPIQSITHDADRPLRAGDVVTVTMQAQPGGQATFSLGTAAQDVPMREATPGSYVGRYRVRAVDRLRRAAIVVDFMTPDGKQLRQEATAPVNLLTEELRAPTITAPTQITDADEAIVIAGTGTPSSRVLVTVSYTGRAFNFLPVNGTLDSQEVTVDRAGNWRTPPLEGRLPAGVRRPEYTIRAVAVDAAGMESKPTTVTLRGR